MDDVEAAVAVDDGLAGRVGDCDLVPQLLLVHDLVGHAHIGQVIGSRPRGSVGGGDTRVAAGSRSNPCCPIGEQRNGIQQFTGFADS